MWFTGEPSQSIVKLTLKIQTNFQFYSNNVKESDEPTFPLSHFSEDTPITIPCLASLSSSGMVFFQSWRSGGDSDSSEWFKNLEIKKKGN